MNPQMILISMFVPQTVTICKLFSGFYRVNYDQRNWKLIMEQLKEDHTKIHVINRAQLMDDAFNLARVGRINYDLLLDMAEYLSKETEFFPWHAAFSGFAYLNNMLEESESYGYFKVNT